jgi:hypothetical protein
VAGTSENLFVLRLVSGALAGLIFGMGIGLRHSNLTTVELRAFALCAFSFFFNTSVEMPVRNLHEDATQPVFMSISPFCTECAASDYQAQELYEG